MHYIFYNLLNIFAILTNYIHLNDANLKFNCVLYVYIAHSMLDVKCDPFEKPKFAVVGSLRMSKSCIGSLALQDQHTRWCDLGVISKYNDSVSLEYTHI